MALVNLTVFVPTSRRPLTEDEAGSLVDHLLEDPLNSAVVISTAPAGVTVVIDVDAPSIAFAVNHAVSVMRNNFALLGDEVRIDLGGMSPIGPIAVEVVVP